MEFKQQQQQINSQIRRGDRKNISARAKVSSVTLWKALKIDSISEMTDHEKKAWIAAVEYVNEKQVRNEEIGEMTSSVFEKI